MITSKQLNRLRDEAYATARETAGYLGVSVETVYKWTKDGKLRKFRRGGRTGYLKSELDKVFMVE